jgi:hypothetical protein
MIKLHYNGIKRKVILFVSLYIYAAWQAPFSDPQIALIYVVYPRV